MEKDNQVKESLDSKELVCNGEVEHYFLPCITGSNPVGQLKRGVTSRLSLIIAGSNPAFPTIT